MQKVFKSFEGVIEYLNKVDCYDYICPLNAGVSLFLNIRNGRAHVACAFYSEANDAYTVIVSHRREIRHDDEGDYILYCDCRHNISQFSYVGDKYKVRH